MTSRRSRLAITIHIIILCSFGSLYSAIYTVDIGGLPLPESFSASALVGLVNRHAGKPLILGKINPNDDLWLTSAQQDGDLPSNDTVQNLASLTDLAALAVGHGAVEAVVLYSALELWSLPNVATLAGIYKAVPMASEPADSQQNGSEQNSSELAALLKTLPVKFDARGAWQDAVEATEWALSNLHRLCNSTANLVVLQEPALLQAGFLVDLVTARQLFAYHLPEMCTRRSKSNTLFNTIADSARLHNSILSLLGYFPSQEVVALCSEHHTEVSLVADYCSSLSFWSLLPPVDAPLQQPAKLPIEPYDHRKTYIAIIASDGDNMQMMFNIRRQAMERRVELCAQPGATCPPMTWTISNRLAEFGPHLLQWYFRQAAKTGKDSYLMGPSGYGFLHPSLIDREDPLLPAFINRTEAAAELLDTSAYVHWDDYNNARCKLGFDRRNASTAKDGRALSDALRQEGEHAAEAEEDSDTISESELAAGCSNELDMERYLRRLAGTNIKSVFSPILPFVPRHIEELATFRELYRWFATDTGASLAKLLGNYRRGTVGYVYMIPGVTMDAMEVLGKNVPEHVKLVGYRELADISTSTASLKAAAAE